MNSEQRKKILFYISLAIAILSGLATFLQKEASNASAETESDE